MKNLEIEFDLHMHSVYSDGRATPNEIVEIAKAKNIGLCVTDHNHIKGSIIAKNLADKASTPALCGIELGTNEGKEMLIYFDKPYKAEEFYTKEVEAFKTSRMTRISRSMWDFVGDEYRYLKNRYEIFFTTFPHPYGVLYKNIKSDIMLGTAILKVVDGVEAINLSMSSKANAKAYLLGKDTGKILTASSDAHLKSDIAAVTTKLKFDENSRIISSDISHNFSSVSMLKNSLALLQITKENINYSLLKRGSFRL